MIYLDHTATMIPERELLEYYVECALEYPANPASIHSAGFAARKAQASAINQLAKSFDCRPEELLITSGGSESINMAIKGALAANKRLGQRVLISEGEHSAVAETAKWLTSHGYIVETIGLSAEGIIDLKQLEQALKKPAAMLSLIYVNNETGAAAPVEEVVRLRNSLQPDMLIHVDGVQACGKLSWSFKRLGVDLFSGSGHKFGAPRGIGFLIHRYGIKIEPLIHGGGQQRGLRSGTENVPLVMTMARAAEIANNDLAQKTDYISGLKRQLLDRLTELGVSYMPLSPVNAVPGIVSLAVEGLRGETLLHALENNEIFVSTGSACSSKKREESAVLRAMKLPEDLIKGSIRISLSKSNTIEEIDTVAEAISQAVKWLVRR
ncbi:MAG: cysteine desulfurase [Clostridiaceae bacterium]|nr:cysteine desulfurase [Clostridiaceae bacterium]